MMTLLWPLALKYWRGLAVAGGVLFLAAGYFAWRAHERDLGASDVVQQINQQNQEARDAALSGIHDVDACYAAGGVWSVAADNCQRQ